VLEVDKMSLRLVKNQEELKQIAQMLKRFYEERPDSYGLMDREQAAYDAYAEAISRNTSPSGKVLDLGCGTYRTPLLIHQRGFAAAGCDIFSDEKLHEYRARLPANGPELVAYDGATLPFDDHTFDTVASLCVFEHVTNVEAILNEISRVLKSGGRMIIMGPNLSGPHRAVLAMTKLLKGQVRYGPMSSLGECLSMFITSIKLAVELGLARAPRFVYVFPMIKNGQINFEQPDDDAIHLNCPLSYKKWFRQNGFVLNQYNAGAGESPLTRFYNRLLPSLATTIQIVAQKV
jgi:ubiquinone/menaquinone biosynthesis C-methylase UbiE